MVLLSQTRSIMVSAKLVPPLVTLKSWLNNYICSKGITEHYIFDQIVHLTALLTWGEHTETGIPITHTFTHRPV